MQHIDLTKLPVGRHGDSMSLEWIFLSHTLDSSTPLYGSEGRVGIKHRKIEREGYCVTTSDLELSAHAGTHVDAPRHFDIEGICIDELPAAYWHCVQPWLIECSAEPGQILGLSELGADLEAMPDDTDLLLLRTGFEVWRSRDAVTYAKRGPGLAPEVADWLRRNRHVRILGFDFISVSSFARRDLGRDAHRRFLCFDDANTMPIMLLEDMALARITKLHEVWVVPLRYTEADGAPVTVLALIDGGAVSQPSVG